MKVLLVYLIALISSAVADNDYRNSTKNREKRAVPPTVPELITNNGYTAEAHKVITRDGYILEMHRISATPTRPAAYGKPVIFIMHGLLSSSADWIITGPGKGLAYILADAGYDVWMGNARGNTYSKHHRTITDLSGRDFWNFDWHEIGIYDLPAMIDYALQTTGQRQLVYIGYSQGTTSFYVMASLYPEYNNKIKVMFSLAPVAYMGHARSPLLRLASIGSYSLSLIGRLLGPFEFLPTTELLRQFGSTFCRDGRITQRPICLNVLFELFGFNQAQMNTTALPTILEHVPAGASTRQLLHYIQEAKSHRFAWYDYNPIGNLATYGSWYPPNYDLSKISTPVHLIYSDNDWMSAVKDVKQLYRELGNPIEMFRVLDGNWNHLDYLWGIDVKQLVYDHILATLRTRYNY